MAKLWSFTCGKRGESRVRVYERRPGAPLQIEWYLAGKRYQRSLKYETGATIYDRDDAVRIAKRASLRLEQAHRGAYRSTQFAPSPARSLADLFDRLHRDKQDEWSADHLRHQEQYRKLWVQRLGKDARLVGITPAMIEEAGKREAKERGWSPRSHQAFLRYVVDAFSYAEQKLKWIDPRNNLAGVTIPEAKSKGRPYSLEEMRRILPALAEVDPVAEWMGHLLWQTGRRLSAARTLPKTAVSVREGYSVIRWPQETDKAGKVGASVVVGRAHDLTVALMEQPGKYVAGKEPPSVELLDKEWMPAAERIAGVAHVAGRAWHGIKRRFSDRTEGLKSRAVQAGTREETLRRVYDPGDDVEAMMEVAKKLASEVGTA